MALARRKLSLIHIAKARLGLGDAVYREILMHYGGVSSSRDLDQTGFELVMEAFHRRGFQSDFAKRNFGRRPGMASARQVAYIRHLWANYTDGQGDDKSLGKWLDHTFKVTALRFVRVELAPKVTTALRAMNAKRAA